MREERWTLIKNAKFKTHDERKARKEFKMRYQLTIYKVHVISDAWFNKL